MVSSKQALLNQCAAIDEAVRNVVAVGADPSRIALLDNFCWGNTDRPEVLGSLVRAAEACRDVALAYRMPFISGKDSLKNEYNSHGRHIVIQPTLLISAMVRVPDVRRCVTMDLKEAGNHLFLLCTTKPENAHQRRSLASALHRLTADPAGPRGEGVALTHRRHERRMGGVGQSRGVERSLAETVTVTGRVRRSTNVFCVGRHGGMKQVDLDKCDLPDAAEALRVRVETAKRVSGEKKGQIAKPLEIRGF